MSFVVMIIPVLISSDVKRDLFTPWKCLIKGCENRPEWWYYALSLLFIAACILLIVIGIYEAIMSKTYTEVVNINKSYQEDRKQVNNLINRFRDLYPKALCEELNFSDQKNDNRMTFFLYDKEKDNFLNFSRRSSNPAFLESSRQGLYSREKGCICKAWEKGFHFDNGFPNPDNIRRYCDYTIKQKYNFLQKEVENLRMKSRLYCAWSIKDMDGVHDVAVIVIESTDPNKWTEEELKDFLRPRRDIMRQYIGIIEGITPKLSIANKADL